MEEQTSQPGSVATPPKTPTIDLPLQMQKKPRKWLSVLLILTLIGSTTTAVYFAYRYYKLEGAQGTEVAMPSPRAAKATLPPQISVTPTISPIDNQKVDEEIIKGMVKGKICYPSSMVPEGYIVAKNRETNQVEKTYFEGVPPKSQEYSLDLPPGKYVFAYQPEEGLQGFYTPCALAGDINDCSTPESHQLTEVEVISGKTVEGISLCDYYYPPEQKPSF